MFKKFDIVFFQVCLFCLVSIASLSAKADNRSTITSARSFIESGQPSKALKILLPLEYELSGDVHYDYLLSDIIITIPVRNLT